MNTKRVARTDVAINSLALAQSDQELFINKMMVLALDEQKRTGLSAGLLVAQAALESGYGKSALSQPPANNFFGIKDKRFKETELLRMESQYLPMDPSKVYEPQDGSNYVLMWSKEKFGEYRLSAFCKFDSLQDCLRARSTFFMERINQSQPGEYFQSYSVMRKLLEMGVTDTVAWINAIPYGNKMTTPYALDPKYASKLLSVAQRYDLCGMDVPVTAGGTAPPPLPGPVAQPPTDPPAGTGAQVPQSAVQLEAGPSLDALRKRWERSWPTVVILKKGDGKGYAAVVACTSRAELPAIQAKFPGARGAFFVNPAARQDQFLPLGRVKTNSDGASDSVEIDAPSSSVNIGASSSGLTGFGIQLVSASSSSGFPNALDRYPVRIYRKQNGTYVAVIEHKAEYGSLDALIRTVRAKYPGAFKVDLNVLEPAASGALSS